MTTIEQIFDADATSPLRKTHTPDQLIEINERAETLKDYLASGLLSPKGMAFVQIELFDLLYTEKEKTAMQAANQS